MRATMAHAYALARRLHRSLKLADRRSTLIVVAFFASGFSALIYQIIWQRALFTIYGSNIESVTMVVTAFMLGLGLGSLLGGAACKRPGINPIILFGMIEIGIGLFGFLSLHIFDWAGRFTLGLSAAATGLITFGLILLPTLLMGATLPVLVDYFVTQWKNVGATVGLFYFVNTLGSAMGALCGAIVLFGALGQTGSVTLAAVVNTCVGGAVIYQFHIVPQGRGAHR